MKVTAELSLYPLGGENPIAKVIAFIGDLEGNPDIEMVVNQVSTQLRGELDDVLAVIGNAMRNAFATGDAASLVVKFLNADLPIMAPPDLSRSF
jgi:uncharacterized protein YqgV (UPF0045/DUF77 family)